jgi:hypothetical protein
LFLDALHYKYTKEEVVVEVKLIKEALDCCFSYEKADTVDLSQAGVSMHNP